MSYINSQSISDPSKNFTATVSDEALRVDSLELNTIVKDLLVVNCMILKQLATITGDPEAMLIALTTVQDRGL